MIMYNYIWNNIYKNHICKETTYKELYIKEIIYIRNYIYGI